MRHIREAIIRLRMQKTLIKIFQCQVIGKGNVLQIGRLRHCALQSGNSHRHGCKLPQILQCLHGKHQLPFSEPNLVFGGTLTNQYSVRTVTAKHRQVCPFANANGQHLFQRQVTCDLSEKEQELQVGKFRPRLRGRDKENASILRKYGSIVW